MVVMNLLDSDGNVVVTEEVAMKTPIRVLVEKAEKAHKDLNWVKIQVVIERTNA